ncbi:hypothetical protein AB0D30_02635 [Streptomyces sp. NPDC048409]|uniref:hypothetical protein n=1 Tax=Streptomyces sp. NPDC048409 TaxID=3154723 RepID=UPI00343228B6
MAIMRRSLRLAGCVLAAALATASCSSGHHESTSATHPARSARPSPAPSSDSATSDPRGPSVHKAPTTSPDGITALVSGASVEGSAIYPIPGGIKAGKTLAIAINCQGPGRLTVQVKPTNASFPLLCEKGRVLPTMNEIHMSGNHPTSSLHFASEPGVTWSFAVGWDSDPPKQQ